MPRTFHFNERPRFSLPSLRSMRQEFGELEGCLIDVKGLVRNWTYRLWKQWAFGGYWGKVGSVEKRLHCLHGHHAMVFSVHPAASWKARLWRASKCKERRDLRKAEEEQQRDGYRPSHRRGCADSNTSGIPRLVINYPLKPPDGVNPGQSCL
jgi:hypothetical protein